MTETAQERIERALKEGVARTAVDGVVVEVMDVEKQIAANEYLKKQSAVQRNHFGLFLRRIQFGDCG